MELILEKEQYIFHQDKCRTFRLIAKYLGSSDSVRGIWLKSPGTINIIEHFATKEIG